MWNTILTTHDYLLLLVASFWLWSSSTFGVLWMIWCVVAVVFATRSSSWCWILLVGGPCGAFAPRTPSHSACKVGVLNISLGHSYGIASGGQEELFSRRSAVSAACVSPEQAFFFKKKRSENDVKSWAYLDWGLCEFVVKKGGKRQKFTSKPLARRFLRTLK